MKLGARLFGPSKPVHVEGQGTRVTLEDLIASRHQASARRVPPRRGLTGFPGGLSTRRRGQGLEFDDLRLYVEGDDVRHIDWNVTARTGQAHLRLYRQERERSVTVAVDLRPAMFSGTQSLRAVSACRMAAALIWHAADLGDRCGAFVFDGSGHDATRPVSGDPGALRACALIAERFTGARQDAADETKSSALAPVLARIASGRREAGLVVLVTGLDLPGEAWAVHLKEAGLRGRLVTIWVRDPMETDGLPPGTYDFRATDGQRQRVSLRKETAASLRDLLTARDERIRRDFRNAGVPLLETGPVGASPDIGPAHILGA
ncbi:MAG: DUF58 domain-containing protein [Pseudomonadota bacterium]